jgi:hypothetical protein
VFYISIHLELEIILVFPCITENTWSLKPWQVSNCHGRACSARSAVHCGEPYSPQCSSSPPVSVLCTKLAITVRRREETDLCEIFVILGFMSSAPSVVKVCMCSAHKSGYRFGYGYWRYSSMHWQFCSQFRVRGSGLRGREISCLCRSITQAVSRPLPIAAARVRALVRSCGICGGQSDTVADFLRELQFPPAYSHSTNLSTIIIYHLGLLQ